MCFLFNRDELRGLKFDPLMWDRVDGINTFET